MIEKPVEGLGGVIRTIERAVKLKLIPLSRSDMNHLLSPKRLYVVVKGSVSPPYNFYRILMTTSALRIWLVLEGK